MDGRSSPVICGDEDGKAVVYTSDDVATAPSITLTGDSVKDDAYYTVLLSNPDDTIPVGPIIHKMMGNILGSDSKLG